MQTSTIVTATAATILAAGAAYAVYFDYKRRNDPDFRKQLLRNRRKHAKAQRAEASAANAALKQQLKQAVKDAMEEGFPTDNDEREAYFMEEVALGEKLCHETEPQLQLESAMAFYKALKVYPSPRDLMQIYESTVPKNVLDLLAEMMAQDPSIKITVARGPSGMSIPGMGSLAGATLVE